MPISWEMSAVPPAQAAASTPPTGAVVEVQGLSKVFSSHSGDVEAIRDVSFSAPAGSRVALLGPSGCGKSTLLRIVAGLLSYAHGSVTVDGERVRKTLTNLGMVFQAPTLLDWMTVEDNICLQGACRSIPTAELRERAHQLLSMVSLEGFADRYPYELSGGMQQRAALCRALVHRPPLLLMDEPFGAVDALTRDQIAVDIQPLLGGSNATVLLVTHSISEAVFLSDRVMIFTPRPARIVECVDIPFDHPRRLELKAQSSFATLVGHITETFERLGVLG